jgi:hypothetical protein
MKLAKRVSRRRGERLFRLNLAVMRESLAAVIALMERYQLFFKALLGAFLFAENRGILHGNF